MDVPDFTRAEYHESNAPIEPAPSHAHYPLALVYGAAMAVVGALGYSIVALSGFMVSIVAIAMAWLIAKGMMTATHGRGGRLYQVTAVILTYFSVSLGQTLGFVWYFHREGTPFNVMLPGFSSLLLKEFLMGPFLRGLSGIIGLVIIAIGMFQAWRMAAGSPGFTANR